MNYDWDLCASEGFKPTEAAMVMGVTPGVARKEMAMARERLRKAVEARQHPNVYEALVAWGSKGRILRGTGRVHYREAFPIPQEPR